MHTGKLGLIAAAVLAIGPAEAATVQSYCMEPRAPSAFLTRPRLPFCASTRSCSELDASMYQNAVRQYFNQLEEYASAVDRYYRQALEYVRCMSDLD